MKENYEKNIQYIKKWEIEKDLINQENIKLKIISEDRNK